MQLAEQELARNVLTANVRFRGRNRGYLGVVYTSAKYLAEIGINWTVLAVQDVYPTFVVNATNKKKKLAISAFIRDKYGISAVEAIQ